MAKIKLCNVIITGCVKSESIYKRVHETFGVNLWAEANLAT